jgi:hypothetical protein
VTVIEKETIVTPVGGVASISRVDVGAAGGGDGTTVTVADADLVESATEVAVTITVAGFGTLTGAVYFPVASIVPQLTPVQPVPEMLQVTA